MRIVFASLVFAFCGLNYELTLAQTLSITLGNSYLQYSLTIGLFMAGMGIGSLRAEKITEISALLIRLQLLISIVAPLGFLLLWLSTIYLPIAIVWILACILVFSIGVITGTELPLLMTAARKENEFYVLSADYIGMLLACVLFPLLLLPRFGLFGTLFCTSLLNALSIQLLLDYRSSVHRRLLYLATPSILVLLVLFEGSLRLWFSQQYISASL